MSLMLRRKKDGLILKWDLVTCKPGPEPSDGFAETMLPQFIKDEYEVVKSKVPEASLTGKVLVPKCGWENLTLENFESEMGYRFRIEQDQSASGMSREVAFLEYLESKGVKRQARLVEGLTLANFQEKMGQRFRMTKEDKGRNLTRDQAFTQWLKRNGY